MSAPAARWTSAGRSPARNPSPATGTTHRHRPHFVGTPQVGGGRGRLRRVRRWIEARAENGLKRLILRCKILHGGVGQAGVVSVVSACGSTPPTTLRVVSPPHQGEGFPTEVPCSVKHSHPLSLPLDGEGDVRQHAGWGGAVFVGAVAADRWIPPSRGRHGVSKGDSSGRSGRRTMTVSLRALRAAARSRAIRPRPWPSRPRPWPGPTTRGQNRRRRGCRRRGRRGGC